MNAPHDDSHAGCRRGVYTMLIVLGTGVMLGRILAVDDVQRTGIQQYRIQGRLAEKHNALIEKGLKDDDPRMKEALDNEEQRLRRLIRLRRAFLSANDRSRWCTVRALVEPEMRVAGAPYAIDKVVAQPNWDTIDKVKHDEGRGGLGAKAGHLYSSKPPLLSTLLAAEYWVIYRLTGYSLATHPYAVGRFMLITVNVVPLLIYFLLLARLAERFGTTDWGRIFVVAAAVFGTFLTTFAVVINNHLPAAASAIVALYAAIRIWFDGQRRLRYFVLAGLFAAFAAASELPALALLAALGVVLLWKAPRQTMLAFVPAVLVVAAGFFGTNWIAHRSLRPPYMHRSKTDDSDNWYKYAYVRDGRVIRSYWENPVGIDRGEPSAKVYALHVLVGHHGVFSLTPVWLMSVGGLAIWLFRPDDRRLRELALLIAAVSLVCLAFYLVRPQEDRNYGGMTSGFRWLFWFAPMWLTAMLPAADAMAGRKWTQAVALLLLTISVLSASYPTWNPWTHPWLLDYLHYLGWIRI